MAKLLEGKPVAEKIKEQVKLGAQKLSFVPVLASVLVGDNHSADAYVRSQQKIAVDLGIAYRLHQLPENISEEALIDFINKLNVDSSVNGIIVQMPLPRKIDSKKISESIAPKKDIEGMRPCTAVAVTELLDYAGINLYGKEAVIVGYSEIVGKPLAPILLEKFATVTVCHIATSEAGKLADHVRRAEVLVVAVGQAGLIKGEWIKEGAVVIDVGINRVGDRIVGDVEFEAAEKRAGFITPVPGGVGPLTVTILMRNLVEAAKLQQ